MNFLVLLSCVLISTSAIAMQNIEISVPAQTEEFLSYNFGTVPVNSRHTVRYNLRNTGSTPLTFSTSYIYGADYSAVHSCRNGLLPGERCQFEAAFWPAFPGMSSGRFVLEFVEDQVVLDLWGNAR